MTPDHIDGLSDFPKGESIIGNLLLAYGDLEVWMASCLGATWGESTEGFKVLYRLRSEANRLDIADALLVPAVTRLKLLTVYNKAYAAMRHCKKIRNQYAHCQWSKGKTENEAYFLNLEQGANAEGHLRIYHVDLPLLVNQQRYFRYCADLWCYLQGEIELRDGLEKENTFRSPKVVQETSLHNPPRSRARQATSSSR